MQTKSIQSVVGLTGTNASGKGAAASFFIKHGYTFFSLSDILRDHMLEHGIFESRHAFIEAGTQLRQKFGVDVLAQKTLEKIKRAPGSKFIIDSFRHPSEVNLFREAYNDFLLLCIDAPVEIRFERAKNRGRAENAESIEEFIANEKLESSSNTQAQQLDATLKQADHILINNTNLVQLNRQLETFLR